MGVNNITYENYFIPNIKNFVKITLSEDRRKKLATAIGIKIKATELKRGRKLLDIEINNFRKTYMQTAGDLVLEQHLRLSNLVNFDKIHDENRISFLNDILPSKNIDIVTFEYGLFPMVYKKTYRKTIFVCMINKTEFYLCGVAKPETVNGYSRTDLLVSSYFKSQGRAAFFGFDKLSPITGNLGDFMKLIS
jgi:hypothetical protein